MPETWPERLASDVPGGRREDRVVLVHAAELEGLELVLLVVEAALHVEVVDGFPVEPDVELVDLVVGSLRADADLARGGVGDRGGLRPEVATGTPTIVSPPGAPDGVHVEGIGDARQAVAVAEVDRVAVHVQRVERGRGLHRVAELRLRLAELGVELEACPRCPARA
jgi:hypothetical protein